ncbi:uncharacterized protein H6S33_004301 [Morchella sextelata]|uniref:uncharacterized protein n=1 Tax=Morchella sextelata TaxID=1174677 RepID=UPI001D059D23|nr:uncharacterized protein H6S33_004301 [Morchella sextelata]KAH0605844.1 hypothetical protein H6S33_004301 [Morchella sextelata]
MCNFTIHTLLLLLLTQLDPTDAAPVSLRKRKGGGGGGGGGAAGGGGGRSSGGSGGGGGYGSSEGMTWKIIVIVVSIVVLLLFLWWFLPRYVFPRYGWWQERMARKAVEKEKKKSITESGASQI